MCRILFFCFLLLISLGARAQEQVLCLKSAEDNLSRIKVILPVAGYKTGGILFEKSASGMVIYRRSEIVEEKGPPATVVQEFIAFLNGQINGVFRLTTMGATVGAASFSRSDGSRPVTFFDDQDSQGQNDCSWEKR